VAKRLIGLDIGTNAVTVAEVAPGDPPVLRAFGQVGLPTGAVIQGEVVDPTAVTEAVKRLWHEVGLPKRAEVRVGVATPRVVVRQIDLPEMADTDIAGALRFQASELIPIPLEEAAYDYLVLDHFAAPSEFEADAAAEDVDDAAPDETAPEAPVEQDTVRILLAAAQRSIVDTLVGCVRSAGLRVGAVDLVPLALIRSLGRRVAANGPGAEAIVSLGAGVSVVVVHEAGVPRFVRMVGRGGHDLTEALATSLDVPFATAEAVKRGADDLPDDVVRAADEALVRPLGDLLEEVRSSLDYYRAQPDALPLLRVVLTGGGSQFPGLDEQIQELIDLPVESAQPRLGLTVDDIGFADEQLPDLDPYLPTATGLALGGLPYYGRTVDLLRGESGVPSSRRNALIAGAAAAVVAALLIGLSVLRSQQVDDKQNEVDEQVAQNAMLQAQVDDLTEVQQRESEVEGLRQQVVALLGTDVSWSSLLQEIARTIPNDVWLTEFQGQVTPTDQAALPEGGPPPDDTSGADADGTTDTSGTTVPGQAAIGTLNFQARGLDYPSVSAWLQRIGDIPAFSGLWVPDATASDADGRVLVDFTSDAELTISAASRRAAELIEEGLGDGTGPGGGVNGNE